MKLYVDTNVYLDYLLERRNSNNSFKLFKDTISCKHKIIISDQVLYELSKHMDPKNAIVFFNLIDFKLIKIKSNEYDELAAKQLNTHFEDALHIVLAKKSDADLIVTRNIDDFEHLFKTKRPENV